jgi:3,4-dihydroxy 2-butanone 4-phosphate synthase/GTP cyclohydrolase II
VTTPPPGLGAALRDLAGGGVVTLAQDDPTAPRALVAAAERMTAATANLMATRGHSLLSICLPLARYEALGLPPVDLELAAARPFAALQSIEAADGVTTGISAEDRARTVRAAAGVGRVRRPGHVLVAPGADGGVLAARRLREAASDLAALAGASPVAVICPVLDADGVPLTSGATRGAACVGDVLAWRLRRELSVRRADEELVSTPQGRFRAIAYEDSWRGAAAVALVAPGAGGSLTTVHECVPGQAACGCHTRLSAGLAAAAAGGGAVLRLAALGACGALSTDVAEAAYAHRLVELVAADLGLPVADAPALAAAA